MKYLLTLLALVAFFAHAQDNTLVIGVDADPPVLDPTIANQGITYRPSSQVYEGLVFRTPDTNEIIPRLATSWEQIDDTTWRFELLEGVQFADGTPFNAEAVKFSLERFINPETKAANAFTLKALKEVQVVDDTTVDLILNFPYAPLLANLAIFNPVIISPTAFEQHGEDYPLHPSGTGAYQLVEYSSGNRIVLERNPLWREEPAPFEQIIFRVIPDEVTQIAELRSGGIHLLQSVTPNILREFADDPDFSIVKRTSFGTSYLGFNTKDGLATDPKVRHAIAKAIDRDAIVNELLEGLAERGEALIPDIVFGVSKNIEPIPYDPEAAKQELADAGIAPGTTLKLLATNAATSQRLAQAVQFNLQQVGLEVEIVTSDFASYRSALQQDGYGDLFLNADGPTSLDADFAFTQYFDSKEIPINNYTRYNNPKVDELLAKARAESDPEVRLADYETIQQELYRDLPLFTLYYPVTAYVKTNRLQGEQNYWHGSYISYLNASLETVVSSQ
jgi:peptide/nickel transport system substrate-binding protein